VKLAATRGVVACPEHLEAGAGVELDLIRRSWKLVNLNESLVNLNASRDNMRRHSIALFAASASVLAIGCATAPVAKAPEPSAPPTPVNTSSLTLNSLTADEFTPLSFVLHAGGELGPGAHGAEVAWTVKNDQGPLGAGSAPLAPADHTFSLSIPVAFAKTLQELDAYQAEESMEVTLEATVGEASGTRTLRMQSPRIPAFKVPFAEATLQSSGAIALAFLLAMDNPNPYPLKISAIVYKCSLDGKLVAETESPVHAKLAASSHTEYTLNSRATEENLGKDLRALIRRSSLHWKLEAQVHFADLDVPFHAEGDVALDKD